MDAAGRTVRWLHSKRKYAAFALVLILGGLFWYQWTTYDSVTWCPAWSPTTVEQGVTTWERLASSSHLPVRALKICNWQNPLSQSPLVPGTIVWVPPYWIMLLFIVLIWLALQTFNMPGLVSLVLLYVMMRTFVFGIDFSLCPGTTRVLTPGDSIWSYSTTRVKGVVFCNLGLVGADFTKLPVGFTYTDPFSIWTGPVIVMLVAAAWQIFKKES